jgi:peptidoglycan/xylan/chitin deacetylase (PgdA/CDA1 family)
LTGRILWRLPFHFQIASLVGPNYTLRCLLFHDVADRHSEFTKGLNVTISTEDFHSKIRFILRYYSPIGLQDYIDGFRKKSLPPRPALITFDDAYASVASDAAPILRQYKIPAVFFVASSLVGNEDLGLDNLLCYVANSVGMGAVNLAAVEVMNLNHQRYNSLEQVFDHLLPTMSQEQIRKLREALASTAGINTSALARRNCLYVNAEQLRSLTHDGFEIGNHTSSHVFCRSLSEAEFDQEIYASKTRLESIVGLRVRAFSVPYGSPQDLTEDLARHLRLSEYEAVFLARNRTNTHKTKLNRLNRIDVHAGSDGELFGEIEVLPRLRSLADSLIGKS